jgi:hypothetical protein
VTALTNQFAVFWRGHGDQIMLAGLAVTAVTVVVSAAVAGWRRRIDRWVATVQWIATFGFSGEGMWVVTTQRAHVPPMVAVGVFAVGEAMLLNSMIQARRRYKLTNDPGKHGRAVWIIAIAMGVIVSFAATNTTERLLRLLIPIGAAYNWWNTLTDEGVTKQDTQWRWTPSRLLEWLGAKEPAGQRDLTTAARERRIAAMARCGYRVHTQALGCRLPVIGSAARFHRMGLTADDEMIAQVAARVRRALRIVTLTRPSCDAATATATAPASVATGLASVMAARRDASGGAIPTATGAATLAGSLPANGDATPAATMAVTLAGSPPASGGATRPTSPPAIPVAAVPATRPASAASAAPADLPQNALRIARYRTRHPGASQKQVAAALSKSGDKVSERTVQRYWTDTAPGQSAEPAAPVNGHDVADLLTATSPYRTDRRDR